MWVAPSSIVPVGDTHLAGVDNSCQGEGRHTGPEEHPPVAGNNFLVEVRPVEADSSYPVGVPEEDSNCRAGHPEEDSSCLGEHPEEGTRLVHQERHLSGVPA